MQHLKLARLPRPPWTRRSPRFRRSAATPPTRRPARRGADRRSDATGLLRRPVEQVNPLDAPLAALATNIWRAQSRMLDPKTGRARQESRRLYRHIEGALEAFAAMGVRRADWLGQPDDTDCRSSPSPSQPFPTSPATRSSRPCAPPCSGRTAVAGGRSHRRHPSLNPVQITVSRNTIDFSASTASTTSSIAVVSGTAPRSSKTISRPTSPRRLCT